MSNTNEHNQSENKPIRKADKLRKQLRESGYYNNVREMTPDKPLDPDVREDYLLGKSIGVFD